MARFLAALFLVAIAVIATVNAAEEVKSEVAPKEDLKTSNTYGFGYAAPYAAYGGYGYPYGAGYYGHGYPSYGYSGYGHGGYGHGYGYGRYGYGYPSYGYSGYYGGYGYPGYGYHG